MLKNITPINPGVEMFEGHHLTEKRLVREWSLWLLILIAAVIAFDIITKVFAFPIFLVLLQVEVLIVESFIARHKL